MAQEMEQQKLRFQPKKYEVELASTTCRTYWVTADSPEAAGELALSTMSGDWEIHQSWKENAEVNYVEEMEDEDEY